MYQTIESFSQPSSASIGSGLKTVHAAPVVFKNRPPSGFEKFHPVTEIFPLYQLMKLPCPTILTLRGNDSPKGYEEVLLYAVLEHV